MIVKGAIQSFFQTGYDIIKEICGDMDLTSESHYKEYGLFTYIEARKLNQRSKADQNGMKTARITQLVLQFKVVFGLKIYKPVCTLCFLCSNCVNDSVTKDNTEGLYFQTKEKFEACSKIDLFLKWSHL